jgi:hypothetical protein
MSKGKIFNIRVTEDEYAKLKSLGSNRAREILLGAVNGKLFEKEPESEIEKLIYKYELLDTLSNNLKDKQRLLTTKALLKLSNDDYEAAVLTNFDNFFSNVKRIVANLQKEKFELIKLRRQGIRYVFSGLRELALKNGLGHLNLPDHELYVELASRNLIDHKEKYRKNVSKAIQEIQDKAREQETLYNSLREMLPYIIMRENVAGEIDKVEEEKADVLFVIEHLETLEQQYAHNFFESIKFSNVDERESAYKLLDNKDYIENYYDSDLPLVDKFEKYLICCGVGEQRAKAIRKKYMT